MRHRGVSVSRVLGRRGAGLGNEILPWAKAALASQELGLRLARPAWAWHPEKYPEAWGWSRVSLAAEYAAGKMLPSLVITEDMYRATGLVDYGAAVRAIAQESAYFQAGGPLRIVSEGMWGGYQAIELAKPFLWRQLLTATGVPTTLSEYRRRVGARVAAVIHIRGGDFTAQSPQPGQFNKRLPIEWYLNVGKEIRRGLGSDVYISVVTDSPRAAEVVELSKVIGAEIEVAPFRESAAIADLAILASADLAVCSVSSFSMAGAFLSDDAPYIWYGPQLSKNENGWGIWGHEPHQRRQELADGDVIQEMLPRGVPMGVNDPLPEAVTKYLLSRASVRCRRLDLLYYGSLEARGGHWR